MTTIPVTLQMLKKGELKVGDSVLSTINYTDPKTGKQVFVDGEEYPVTEIFPPANPEGYVLNSEVGRWWLYFREGGGGGLFEKVTEKTEEDELGDYGTTCFDILRLVSKKIGIKRREIVEFLSYTMGADTKGRRRILDALRLLEVRGYISLESNSLDTYDMTH